MTNKEYQNHAGLSRSNLWEMSKSPQHFIYALNHPAEDTPALRFGTAAHKYILERPQFYDDIAILPYVNRRTKEGKAFYDRFIDDCKDKTIITAEDLSVITDMGAAIDANPLARQLLIGEHERSVFWTDAETGIECKCRPDCLTVYNGQPLIVDYKTTDSCADGHFERACKKYGYMLQSGMYCEGMLNADFTEYGFAFVAQEKKPPYAVRVYFCTKEFIAQGYDLFREYLGTYLWCCKNRKWYGYEGPEGIAAQLCGEEEREYG